MQSSGARSARPDATTGPVGAPVGDPPGGSTEMAIVAPCCSSCASASASRMCICSPRRHRPERARLAVRRDDPQFVRMAAGRPACRRRPRAPAAARPGPSSPPPSSACSSPSIATSGGAGPSTATRAARRGRGWPAAGARARRRARSSPPRPRATVTPRAAAHDIVAPPCRDRAVRSGATCRGRRDRRRPRRASAPGGRASARPRSQIRVGRGQRSRLAQARRRSSTPSAYSAASAARSSGARLSVIVRDTREGAAGRAGSSFSWSAAAPSRSASSG